MSIETDSMDRAKCRHFMSSFSEYVEGFERPLGQIVSVDEIITILEGFTVGDEDYFSPQELENERKLLEANLPKTQDGYDMAMAFSCGAILIAARYPLKENLKDNTIRFMVR